MAGVILKSKTEIELMRKAGRIVAEVHARLRDVVRPGVSTGKLDQIARETVDALGAKPVFLGYRGYPAAVCASVNNEIVHGIPSPERILEEGDIVSLDFGALYGGFVGDAAVTLPVGKVSDLAAKLLRVTEESLYKGIEQAKVGRHLRDIGAAVQLHAEANGFSVVRAYVGHGVGRSMHESPDVPNFGPKGHGMRLPRGLVIAIEPMINTGTFETRILSDNWTVVTADGGLSAHFEHTVAITPEGPDVLTRL